QSLVDIENDGFLRILRAPRDPYQVLISHLKQQPELPGPGVVLVGLHSIILDRSGDLHSLAWDAKTREAFGIFLGLNGVEINMGQHRSNEKAKPAKASKTARAHSAVHNGHRYAEASGGGQEVRPQLSLSQHDEIGLNSL